MTVHGDPAYEDLTKGLTTYDGTADEDPLYDATAHKNPPYDATAHKNPPCHATAHKNPPYDGLSLIASRHCKRAFLDLGRDPNPHVAFGHGIHRCPASHLARAELRIALTSLLARFPRLRPVAPEASAGWKEHQRIQAVAALPVTW
ncbi:hypothetical protein ACWD0J_35220 [Streptomyces sp. NPDC003011]